VTLGRGRVEISSDVPVSGVALIQTGSQFSSLPLNSTTRVYNVDAYGSDVDFAELTLWTEGLFINGYIAIEFDDALSLLAVTGTFRDGRALLHFDADEEIPGDYGIFGFFVPDGPYDPQQSIFSGSYYVAIPSENSIISGRFDATLVP
jgi:hypothetical protein